MCGSIGREKAAWRGVSAIVMFELLNPAACVYATLEDYLRLVAMSIHYSTVELFKPSQSAPIPNRLFVSRPHHLWEGHTHAAIPPHGPFVLPPEVPTAFSRAVNFQGIHRRFRQCPNARRHLLPIPTD